MNLPDIIRQALEFREPLCTQTEIFRGFAGKSDGLDGVIIDVLGHIVWIRVFRECENGFLRDLYSVCKNIFGDRRLFLSYRKIDNYWITPEHCHESQPSAQPGNVSKEHGISFEIRGRNSEDFGIYTDARAARCWVSSHSPGRNVLNLFAYTCAFGVVAACARASEVCNVDVSRDFLSWGKENGIHNGVDFSVVPEDCLKYIVRLQKRVQEKKKQRPDLIVLDPPAFLAGRGMRRVTRNLWPEYLCNAAKLIQPGGVVLVSCNDAYTIRKNQFSDLLREEFAKAGTSPELKLLKQSPDVLGQSEEQDSHYLYPQFWEAQF